MEPTNIVALQYKIPNFKAEKGKYPNYFSQTIITRLVRFIDFKLSFMILITKICVYNLLNNSIYKGI